MKIKISVKESHIINGECLKPTRCAVYLAVQDVLPVNFVTHWIISLGRLGKIAIELPPVAKNFIKQFDCCLGEGDRKRLPKELQICAHPAQGRDRLKYVQPFSFEIEIPENKIELIWPETKGVLEEARELVRKSKNCEVV